MYLDSTPLRQMAEKWFADSKRSRTNADDAECSGRPNSEIVPENIKKVHKMVLADRKLKLREIGVALKISEGSVFTILHEHLSMRKLCSKSVPHSLTVDPKQQHVDDSERYLELFQRNKTQMSAGKILASVFQDAYDILFIDYLENGRTINSLSGGTIITAENWSKRS